MDLQDHPELRSTALRLGKRGELPVISRGLLITLDYTNSGTTRFGTTNPGDGHQRVTVGFGARRYRPVNDDLIRPNGAKRHRTATEIRAILNDHRQSGLSLVAFARHHQFCYASLLRWRSRYSSEGGQIGSHSEFADEPVLKPRFVPVRMDPDPANGMLDGLGKASSCTVII